MKCSGGRLKSLLLLSEGGGGVDVMEFFGSKCGWDAILCVIRTLKEEICLCQVKCSWGNSKSLLLSEPPGDGVVTDILITIGMDSL